VLNTCTKSHSRIYHYLVLLLHSAFLYPIKSNQIKRQSIVDASDILGTMEDLYSYTRRYRNDGNNNDNANVPLYLMSQDYSASMIDELARDRELRLKPNTNVDPNQSNGNGNVNANANTANANIDTELRRT
jgi:hypothetical protein